MANQPVPLESGTVLSDRFEVVEVLGRGGFGIAYLANDLARQDLVVVKELAPQGTNRREDGVLQLDPTLAHRLRDHFLNEARLLGKLAVPGIPPVRSTFGENGTAYFVTQHIPHTQTLDQVIRDEGRIEPRRAMNIFERLLDTLEIVHDKGILHRDIKPSNVLLGPHGQVVLIDFGAAREWLADSNLTQTVLFTPGYAPPEQLSERARRSPATDIYGACATLYHALAGFPPPPCTDRVAGTEMVTLDRVRSDITPALARVVETGLALAAGDRPQSVQEVRKLLSNSDEPESPVGLAGIDAQLVRLQALGYERRACPSCGGILASPSPLKKGTCPVCREGVIRKRDIHERFCPVCRAGTLHEAGGHGKLAVCPLCGTGNLSMRRRSLLSPERIATCQNCCASFTATEGGLRLEDVGSSHSDLPPGTTHSMEEWRGRSGRSETVERCDSCEALFDVATDGRWHQIAPVPKGRYRSLYPEEWARVAAGLEPGAGNAECDGCGADYYLEDAKLTLLDANHDPFGFSEAFLGRRLNVEDVRWLGAGKESPHQGLVCEDCGSEWDRDDDYLRLVRTDDRRLVRHIGTPAKLEDWHRIALGLPTTDQEQEFLQSVTTAVRDAYRIGEIGFDKLNTCLWKGEATRLSDGQVSTLIIGEEDISFGGFLRKWRIPLDAITGCGANDLVLQIRVSGEKELLLFQIVPVELTAHLTSGDRSVLLTAADLCARLRAHLKV